MFQRIKKGMLLLAAGLIMVSGVACSNNSKSTSEEKATASGSKDELVIAIGKEPKEGFDPTTGWGHSAATIFHSLLFKRDEKLKIVGDLGTEYKISEDGLTWEVKVRDDAKFSNGEKVTVDDIAYSYDAARTNKDSNVDLTMIDKIEKVNDSTLNFKLKAPQSTFIDKLMEIGIVPKDLHEKDPKAYAQNPVGSGPYIMKQWDKGQQVIAEKFEDYYGEKPNFKKLTLVYLKEDAVMTALQSGSIDMAKVTYSNADTKINGYNVKEIGSVENQGICFPMTKAGNTYDEKDRKNAPYGNDVTSDIAIRKAINLGINRQDMIKGLLNGRGTPAYTGFEQMPWNNEKLAFKDGDVQGAVKILEDAGWKMGNDGIRVKDGVKAEFKIIFWPDDEARQQTAIYISEYCKKNLGISIIPTQVEETESQYAMHSDPMVLSWGEHSPQLMYQLFHSKFKGEGWYNAGFYSNPTVDKYLDEALASRDIEGSYEIWKKAQFDGETGFVYQGDAAWAWFMNTNHLYFLRDGLDIGSPKPQPHGGAILDNISDWKFK